MRGKSYEREGLLKTIRRVQRCKGLRDLEFCEVFSRYCGYHKVLLFCDLSYLSNYFDTPILYSLFLRIKKRFSLNCGCRHS